MNKYLYILLAVLIAGCQSPEKVKFERYRVAGERLYLQHCANCHKMDGSGFRKLYPPIAGTDWMEENFAETFCIMKNGSNDSLVINEIRYTLPMDASGLTNLEMAEIGTFVYNSWGMQRGLIDVTEVEKILRDCR